ncbi:Uncharacterized protein HZ326_20942 [Fusarium oxysporum f. sp. albedinis]|nr:Uncharacterized protein HZ326_20942 [Fusarium oxysporum f. sp. albedinis]
MIFRFLAFHDVCGLAMSGTRTGISSWADSRWCLPGREVTFSTPSSRAGSLGLGYRESGIIATVDYSRCRQKRLRTIHGLRRT